jgi:hypothetical protein
MEGSEMPFFDAAPGTAIPTKTWVIRDKDYKFILLEGGWILRKDKPKDASRFVDKGIADSVNSMGDKPLGRVIRYETTAQPKTYKRVPFYSLDD